MIRPYKADCFLCKVRRETYGRTEDLNSSPFTRMRKIGSFALYKMTTGQVDNSAFMTEPEIKCLFVRDTATINPALNERPEKQLTSQTQHLT